MFQNSEFLEIDCNNGINTINKGKEYQRGSYFCKYGRLVNCQLVEALHVHHKLPGHNRKLPFRTITLDAFDMER